MSYLLTLPIGMVFDSVKHFGGDGRTRLEITDHRQKAQEPGSLYNIWFFLSRDYKECSSLWLSQE